MFNMKTDPEKVTQFISILTVFRKHMTLIETNTNLKNAVYAKCSEFTMLTQYPHLVKACKAMRKDIQKMRPENWNRLQDRLLVSFYISGGRDEIGVQQERSLWLRPATCQLEWDWGSNDTEVINIHHFYNHYLYHYMEEEDAAKHKTQSLDEIIKHFTVIEEGPGYGHTLHEILTTWELADIASLRPPSAHDRVLRGYAYLPHCIKLSMVEDGVALCFEMFPHYYPEYRSPYFQAMVSSHGRLYCLYQVRNLCSGKKAHIASGSLEDLFRDMYMGDTSLLDILTTWTPEQISHCGYTM